MRANAGFLFSRNLKSIDVSKLSSSSLPMDFRRKPSMGR
jgi:hypothetical protein